MLSVTDPISEPLPLKFSCTEQVQDFFFQAIEEKKTYLSPYSGCFLNLNRRAYSSTFTKSKEMYLKLKNK